MTLRGEYKKDVSRFRLPTGETFHQAMRVYVDGKRGAYVMVMGKHGSTLTNLHTMRRGELLDLARSYGYRG